MDTITLRDGRTLAFEEYGTPDGDPCILMHGFSDSRLVRNPDDDLTAELGVRIIAPDQPGVGHSSRLHGRTLRQFSDDIAQLADALGLDTFGVAGHSAGSAYAMAVAHFLPHRVTGVTLAAPIAPLDTPGFMDMVASRELGAMARLQRLRLGAIVRGALWFAARSARRDAGAFLEYLAALDKSDRATFLDRSDQRRMFEASFTAGFRQGGGGPYDMFVALLSWGFEPRQIKQPVSLFYSTSDDLIRPTMPRHLADELPDCHATAWEGAGHYGFVDRERWVEFVSAMRSPTGTGATE